MSEFDDIIEDLGFQHSDRDGYMSGIQWKQFAIDLISAVSATQQHRGKNGSVKEQFEAWWKTPEAPLGQDYEKDIAKMAWIASALYRFAAAPDEPLDREAIRSGLLGEVIEWLETEVSAIDTWYRGDPSYEHDAGYMKDRALHLLTEAKTAFEVEQPARPSDSQAEPSDGEIPVDEDDLPVGYADWYNRHFARQTVDMHRFGDCEEAWREAYKAAMRAEREGK